MAVARITEISAASNVSFDDAAKQGIARASETLKNIQSAWIKDSEVTVKNGQIDEYRLHMKVTFVLED